MSLDNSFKIDLQMLSKSPVITRLLHIGLDLIVFFFQTRSFFIET